MVAKYDTKIEYFENNLESVQELLKVNTDNLSQLETESSNISDQMRVIDCKLEDIEKKIEASENMVKQLQLELLKSTSGIKQCKFDRYGYCKEEEACKYFHAGEICSEYIEQGVCIKMECRKRHPRQCRYFQQSTCYRGEECKYLHDKKALDQACHNCKQDNPNKYYCEFCNNNFCSKCTVKEAHEKNIYDSAHHSACCSSIHI